MKKNAPFAEHELVKVAERLGYKVGRRETPEGNVGQFTFTTQSDRWFDERYSATFIRVNGFVRLSDFTEFGTSTRSTKTVKQARIWLEVTASIANKEEEQV